MWATYAVLDSAVAILKNKKKTGAMHFRNIFYLTHRPNIVSLKYVIIKSNTIVYIVLYSAFKIQCVLCTASPLTGDEPPNRGSVATQGW